MIAPDALTATLLRRRIPAWYRQHRRNFPWRSTRDPYKVLVSEIMLQQTQAPRVAEKFPGFLRLFPTLNALATAPRGSVIRAWRGMGYNNRAVRLRDLARTVAADHGGTVPSSVADLRRLPGVGPYTAHAVACFAFARRVPVVDTNIRRLFSRLFWTMADENARKAEEDIWALAGKILPRDAYTWNQALMEFGATICTARSPSCGACPVAEHCRSRGVRRGKGRRPEHPRRRKQGEPSYDGLPVRIWRGRIVERLRDLDGRGAISLPALGRAAKSNFRERDLRWLTELIGDLSRDQLVETFTTQGTLHVRLSE